MRDDDAARFKFAADFVKGRVGAVQKELGSLDGDLRKVVSTDKSTFDASGTRNAFLGGLNRRLDMTVAGFNAFRGDPQLRQMRSDLNSRADRTSFPDSKGGTYLCPDAQLTTALKGVVRAIDELPVVDKPKIAAVEGSEAVIEAFRRLGATFYGALSFKLPPTPEELRDLQKRAVQSVEASAATQARLNAASETAGLSRRDYIPLSIALFVDLCLLLVSIKRPASPLDRLVPKMRLAEQGPVIQILSRFNEIHRDKDIRENFEVFRHVVFDYHGDYYAAIPLNTPYRPNPRNSQQRQGYGVSDAEQLMQEAHLLANLFASFEQERIFTRVLSPLLSTGMVQKRLRRQGSKFANAEAFRVYRFRDGAWSEIILGAVMGAAKRVEAGKRRRRIEEDIFQSGAPTLGASRAEPPMGEPSFTNPDLQPDFQPDLQPRRRARSSELARAVDGADSAAGSEAGNEMPRHAGQGPARGTGGWQPPSRPPFMPHVVQAGHTPGPAARRPANSNTEPYGEAGSPSHPVPSDMQPIPYTDARPAENVVMHPAVHRPQSGATPTGNLAQPSGEMPQPPVATGRISSAALAIQHELAEPATTWHPAPQAPQEPSDPPLQWQPSSGPTVTVAATRETITYTLPVSEARLPAALLARSAAISRSADAIAPAADGPPAPAKRDALPSLPPPQRPLSAMVPADPGDTREAITPPAPPAVELDADEVGLLARRFGPGNREIV